MDFSETIAASDLKGNRSRHLIELMKPCLLSSPLRFIRLLSKSVNLIGCRPGKKGQFS